MKKIIILFILCLFLSGCYDYQELNEIAIVNGIGIDYKDDEYIITAEIIKTSKGESENTIESTTITQKDKNIAKAFQKIENNCDKHIYLKHLNLLVLGTSLREIGINSAIDYIIRDVQINNNYHVIVAENAEELLNIKKEDSISTIIGNTINIITNNDKKNSVDSIANSLLTGKVLVIPYVEITQDQEININKIAYFNKDTFQNITSNKIFNFLINKSDNTIFNQGENTASIHNKKIKFKIKKDKIIIDIKGLALMKSTEPSLSLENSSSYPEIEDILNQQIKKEIEEFIQETYINNQADLLNFQKLYYNRYKKYKENIDYEINVSIKINKNGASLGSVNHE